MQEIADAIQQGAKAYLNRQYTTIGIVGVGALPGDRPGAGAGLDHRTGLRHSARSSPARRGFIGMNVSVRANVRTAQAATAALNDALAVAFAAARSPACWWSVSGLLGVAGFFWYLTKGATGNLHDLEQAADRPRLRFVADLDLRASGRRHLHQGCRRRRRPRRQGRGRHSRGRPPQPRRDRRQRR
jgi:Na+/H+-translocating membrane pyrophosphatase